MKALQYIQMNRLRKDLKNYTNELLCAKAAVGVSILISLLSPFTGEWECTVASLLMVLLTLGAESLIKGQIESKEEQIFQHRLKHGFLDMSRFREFRK